jgi:diguanylate cyclase (GGDEF)-like protein/PAS domain S-box-containing protein
MIDTLRSMTTPVDKTSKKQPVANHAVAIRILFVDDSPTVRASYEKLIASNGYEVETATGVIEGMQKAIDGNFDIAIVDYFMPDGTGNQLCMQLRDNPATAHIACAIITGTYLDKAIIESLDAGAVECMFKNEAQELFLARLKAMSRSIRNIKTNEQERRRLKGILSSVGDGVYGVDNNGLITFINPAALEMLGYENASELIGESPHRIFHSVYEDNSAKSEEACKLSCAYKDGETLRGWELNFITRKGNHMPVEVTVFPLNIDDKPQGSVIAFRNISERKHMEKELKWQASHDYLTNLPNRSHFEEQLSTEVKRLSRSDTCSALLYIDLDRFKYLNDTAGHRAGDQLLVEVGRTLSSRLRNTDTLARLGGDEFAIILRDIDPHQHFQAADDFREVLANRPFSYEGKSYNIHSSIGISVISKHTQSPGEVLAHADIACHIAKSKGRNSTHMFVNDYAEQNAMDRELGWSTRLQNALQNDLFVLYYQPVLPLNDIDCSALPEESGILWRGMQEGVIPSALRYEVLLRLANPQGDLINPDAFVPIAERFGIMKDIDRWVVKRAMKELSRQESHHHLPVNLSLNISGQTLEDDTFAAFVKDTANRFNIDLCSLTFEITETTAIDNIDSASRLISDLRALGCRFALDDFGCGFSSFTHLKFLPVDYIKIDGIFVKGMLNKGIDRAIVDSIVQIAHSVNKQTVAEYVESADILATLKEAGVDYIQGYYISDPLPQIDNPYSNVHQFRQR